MNPVEAAVRRIDAYQQRHGRVAFAFGVIKKFGDDRGGALAGLMTYYGFLAVFPMLLLLTTLLGFVFGHDRAAERAVQHSVLADFPIIGVQLGNAIRPLRGNVWAVVVGLLGLLWGSLGVTQHAQHTMNEVWNIPGVIRPGFLTRLLRGLALIVLLGVGVGLTTTLASFTTFGRGAVALKVAGAVASALINVGLFLVAFRLMTHRSVATRDLVPGAAVAGVVWSALQAFGGYLVGHQLRHASQVYGFFGVVLGLLSWLFLAAQVTVYGAELNVVRARRLWPRSIVQPPLTDADKRTLADIALQGERRPEQTVEVSFDDDVDG